MWKQKEKEVEIFCLLKACETVNLEFGSAHNMLDIKSLADGDILSHRCGGKFSFPLWIELKMACCVGPPKGGKPHRRT